MMFNSPCHVQRHVDIYWSDPVHRDLLTILVRQMDAAILKEIGISFCANTTIAHRA